MVPGLKNNSAKRTVVAAVRVSPVLAAVMLNSATLIMLSDWKESHNCCLMLVGVCPSILMHGIFDAFK